MGTTTQGARAAEGAGDAAGKHPHKRNPLRALRLAGVAEAPSGQDWACGAASQLGPDSSVARPRGNRCGGQRGKRAGQARQDASRARAAGAEAARRGCTARALPLGVSAGRGGRAGPHRPLGGGPGHQLTGPAAALGWCRRSSVPLPGRGAAPRIYSRTPPRLAGRPPSFPSFLPPRPPRCCPT